MKSTDCWRLMDEHERLKGQSAEATERLREGAERRLSPVEYQTLVVAANDARLDAEIARLELEQHKMVHAKAN